MLWRDCILLGLGVWEGTMGVRGGLEGIEMGGTLK